MHLWPLTRLKADSEEELIKAYFEVYLENYVKTKNGKKIIIRDWLGNRIHFNPYFSSFEHAFSKSSSYRFGHGIHDKPFSKERARRILWIKEVLNASGGTIERRAQTKKDSSRNRFKQMRILIVLEENYVVVLEKADTPKRLDFITAFPGDNAYIKKIKRESGWLETKKAPVLAATEALPRP